MGRINQLTNNTDEQTTLESRMYYTVKAVVVPYMVFAFDHNNNNDMVYEALEELGEFVNTFGVEMSLDSKQETNYFVRDFFADYSLPKDVLGVERAIVGETIEALSDELVTLRNRLLKYETQSGNVRAKYRKAS